MELRIGVIGTGAIGEDHIRRLTKVTSGAKVVALSDINVDNAKRIAKEYGATFYKTGNEVIHAEDVDAVVVASWDPTHAGFVQECIKAGKYVLCEKPLATTAEECLEIIDAEINGGKKLVQVGFMRRYDRGYMKLKQIIDSGEIGEPLMVHCCHRNKSHIPQHTSDMTIKNSGIHEIDVLRWLLDDEYESGQAFAARQNSNASKGLEDPQMMLLTTKKGILVDVEVNMSSAYGYDIQCEVVCEKGTIRLPNPSSVMMKKDGNRSYEIYPDWTYRFIEAYDIEFQDWIDSIKAGAPTGPDSWDGYVACVTADTLIDAKKKGSIKKININSKPELYL